MNNRKQGMFQYIYWNLDWSQLDDETKNIFRTLKIKNKQKIFKKKDPKNNILRKHQLFFSENEVSSNKKPGMFQYVYLFKVERDSDFYKNNEENGVFEDLILTNKLPFHGISSDFLFQDII